MESLKMLLPFLLFYFQIWGALGANILFFFGFSTYSHRIIAWPLIEQLSEQGHNVTFLSMFPSKAPNPKVTEMVPADPDNEFQMPDFLNMRIDYGTSGISLSFLTMPIPAIMVCDMILKDPKVIQWAETSKYDLVVIDFLYNDCGLGFAHKFKSKIMLFGTSSVFGLWPESYGINAESNWISDGNIPSKMPLSFFDRVVNTILPLIYYYAKIWYLYPRLEFMLREKLNIPDMPDLQTLDRRTELILTNSHFSEEVPRSLPPFVIPVAGMHCRNTPSRLPERISKFIDQAGENGFIYISFGSALQLGVTPQHIQQAFFFAIGNTSTSFLWRWDHGERPENMPANVHTEKWMPQQDILAHPKVRGFVTHGGLIGIQEAVYHAVPMIVFPVFAEQDYNADRIHRTGRGIKMEIATVKQEELQNAFNALLHDYRYQMKIAEASRRFRDRQNDPVETALWWTEYILRHEDTSFMRPLDSLNQFWFQRHLLDVWAFIFIVVISSLVVTTLITFKLIIATGIIANLKSKFNKSNKSGKRRAKSATKVKSS